MLKSKQRRIWNPSKEGFWNPCKEDFWNPCFTTKVHQPKVHQLRFTTNPSKEGYEIQAKKDMKSKQRRVWNPSKEGFEIQAKKDFDIHANKYPLGHVTNWDFKVQNFWIYE